MTFRAHLRSITNYNIKTLRHAPISELSGSLGDLGTLLPLMIAMSLRGSIDLSSTLVFSGLANILTGALFGVPLPVQPMKAVASVAISQRFSKEETAAAGLTVAFAVLLLSVTGLLSWLNRVVPVPVVKGIQVGAGLNLVITAGSSLIKPLAWSQPPSDNRIWAIAAFLFLLLATLLPRCPYALLVTVLGLVIAATLPPDGHHQHHDHALWHPSPFVPSGSAWKTGAIDAAIPQLPLTTLNSILAVTSLAATLFHTFPPAPSPTSLGLSIAAANILGCFFGAMPVCHGSGGLAGQHRFGARSGASVALLGTLKLLLGLFAAGPLLQLLRRFPDALLGVMVLAAGVELARVGQSVGDMSDLWRRAEADARGDSDGDGGADADGKRREECEREGRDRWTVMLVTVAGCLGFKNDAVGFLAGLVWHFGLRAPTELRRLRSRVAGYGAIRLRGGESAAELDA